MCSTNWPTLNQCIHKNHENICVHVVGYTCCIHTRLLFEKKSSMSINIETASQVIFQVFPRPDYTIRKLQSMIENQVGIHPDLQRLFLKVTNPGSGYNYRTPGSVFLGNLSKTLENYNVKENDTIICVEAGEVTIQTIQQSTFSLWIEPSHTVEQLKYQMEQEFHIPRDTQRMIHRGRGMIDTNHLGYYAIGKDALVHLVFRLTGPCARRPSDGGPVQVTLPIYVSKGSTFFHYKVK